MISDKAIKRFWSRVDVYDEGDCWNWTGGVNVWGYGQCNIDSTTDRCHRWAWRMLCGEIPEGVWVLHTCHNRLCVNPNHLYLGTAKQNTRDSVEAGRFRGFEQGHTRNNGINNPNSKLTVAMVRSLRELSQAGSHTYQQLGEMFGISSGRARAIVLYEAYTDIA